MHPLPGFPAALAPAPARSSRPVTSGAEARKPRPGVPGGDRPCREGQDGGGRSWSSETAIGWGGGRRRRWADVVLRGGPGRREAGGAWRGGAGRGTRSIVRLGRAPDDPGFAGWGETNGRVRIVPGTNEAVNELRRRIAGGAPADELREAATVDTWFLLSARESRKLADKRLLRRPIQSHEPICVGHLLQEQLRGIRSNPWRHLDRFRANFGAWCQACRDSALPEFVRFAKRLGGESTSSSPAFALRSNPGSPKRPSARSLLPGVKARDSGMSSDSRSRFSGDAPCRTTASPGPACDPLASSARTSIPTEFREEPWFP